MNCRNGKKKNQSESENIEKFSKVHNYLKSDAVKNEGKSEKERPMQS